MALGYEILGGPGEDNALLVRIDSGQGIARLLFDCGEGCLAGLGLGEIQQIDHLLFSHLHMDHIGGFDSFFRATFNRADRLNRIWGPPRTIDILHHRFRGFLWNLHAGQPGAWQVADIHPERIERAEFLAADAFAAARPLPAAPRGPALLDEPGWSVEAMALDHQTPSLAYLVREAPRRNIDQARLAALGLAPGPWLNQLKQPAAPDAILEIGGRRYEHAALAAELLAETPGGSIAYLTDFLLDEEALERLAPWLRGCDTLVCESQYAPEDAELAARHHHMTSIQAAELARRAGAGALVLFHVSQRYRPGEWLALLDAARRIFPGAGFPAHWRLDAG